MALILFIYRQILSLRYKVTLTWEKHLLHDWPILLLPNHIALIDPQILITFLGKYLRVSPLASDKYYNKVWLKQVMDLFGTIPIWEMSAWANAEEVKKTFWKVIEWLKEWKNILIYPSGQIYRQGFESIVWKQSVYNVVKMMPENTRIIWIKDRWLWWSMFSMSWDNMKTWLFPSLFKWIRIIIANLIFFIPKRKVSLDIIDITEQLNTYKDMSLNEFNKYLENFYNTDKKGEKFEEKLNYIKHYFYYDDVKDRVEPEMIDWSLKELNDIKNHDLSQIDPEIKEKIISKVAEIKEISKDKVLEDSKLIIDLYFDSLDLAETKSFVQANFPWTSNPPINDLKSVWDLLIMAVWQSENVEKLKECNWWESIWENNLIEKLV